MVNYFYMMRGEYDHSNDITDEEPHLDKVGYLEGWRRLIYATANGLLMLISNTKLDSQHNEDLFGSPISFYKKHIAREETGSRSGDSGGMPDM